MADAKKNIITPGQCRAARAIVSMTQDDLSAQTGAAKSTIANFELGKRQPQARTLADLRKALEAAGVVFLAAGETVEGGEGVRLRQ